MSKNKTEHKIYYVWYKMNRRCYNPNDPKYKDYGARGICVCDEWRDSYNCFKAWAVANGYRDGLSIERIDNDGNYCPGNCKWATPIEQANNKRNNIMITYKGKTQSLAMWSIELGIPYKTL